MGRKLIAGLILLTFIIGLFVGSIFFAPTKTKYIEPKTPWEFPAYLKAFSMEGIAVEEKSTSESFWVELETFTLFIEVAKELKNQGYDVIIFYSTNIYGKYYFWFKLNTEDSSIRWTVP